MHGFFCVCSFVVVYFCKYRSHYTGVPRSNLSPKVYPETMGVPLEEMDAVFGEGATDFVSFASPSLIHIPNLDELQELYENQESEQVSLVGSTRSRRSATYRPPTPSMMHVAREWLSWVVSKRRDRTAYEPIRGDE